MGLTEKIGLAFLTLCQGFANLNSFDILFKIQEKFVPFIVKLLKIEAYQTYSFKILVFFTLQSPLNPQLITKLLETFPVLARELMKNDQKIFNEFLDFLFALKLKYNSSSVAEELETICARITEEHNLNIESINTSKFNISSWGGNILNTTTTNNGIQTKKKYRGLQNLGNSI